MATDGDADVPPACSAVLAASLGAAFWSGPGSHVAPLLGRQAPVLAGRALGWLNAALADA